MMSTSPSSPAEHPAVARWRDEQRSPAVSGEKLLIFAFVVVAPIVLFAWAWLLGFQRHAPLLCFVPVAYVVGCAGIWFLRSKPSGAVAAFLGGSFVLALSIGVLAALSFLLASIYFVPFLAFAVLPCAAVWVLVRPTRSLLCAADFGARPIKRWCAFLCGSVVPIVACYVLHIGIVARGDEYLSALESEDAARIERAAERLRPWAPWIGIERAAVGDRGLGTLSIGSGESRELSALQRKLERARAPFRWPG